MALFRLVLRMNNLSLIIIYGVLGFSQGVPILAAWSYWEEERKLSPSMLSLVFTVFGCVWLLRPIWSAYVDNINYGKISRREYTVYSSFFGSLLALTIRLFFDYPLVCWFLFFLLEIISVILETGIDGYMVSLIKYNEYEGLGHQRLQSFCSSFRALGRLCGNLLGSFIYIRHYYPWFLSSAGLFIVGLLVIYSLTDIPELISSTKSNETCKRSSSMFGLLKDLFFQYGVRQKILSKGFPILMYLLCPEVTQAYFVWLRSGLGIQLWHMALIGIGDESGTVFGGLSYSKVSTYLSRRVFFLVGLLINLAALVCRTLMVYWVTYGFFHHYPFLVIFLLAVIEGLDSFGHVWVILPYTVFGTQRALPGKESSCYAFIKCFEYIGMLGEGVTSSLFLNVIHHTFSQGDYVTGGKGLTWTIGGSAVFKLLPFIALLFY